MVTLNVTSKVILKKEEKEVVSDFQMTFQKDMFL